MNSQNHNHDEHTQRIWRLQYQSTGALCLFSEPHCTASRDGDGGAFMPLAPPLNMAPLVPSRTVCDWLTTPLAAEVSAVIFVAVARGNSSSSGGMSNFERRAVYIRTASANAYRIQKERKKDLFKEKRRLLAVFEYAKLTIVKFGQL